MGFKEYLKGNQAPPKDFLLMLPFLGVIVGIFGAAHYYVYLVVSRSIPYGEFLNVFRVILIVGLCLMPVGFLATWSHSHAKFILITWAGYIWMGFFTLLTFFSIIESILWLIPWNHYSYWVLIATSIIGIWSLYKGLKAPSLVFHKLKNRKLRGLRLVQISDLHVGMLNLNEHWLEKIVHRINDLEPDILALTGDLVEGEFDEISLKLQCLKKLNNVPHKFYTTGNHEYINGSGPWEECVANTGFISLHNNNEIITFNGSKILVAGVPDRMIKRFIKNKKSLPDVALKTTDSVDYKILLAHQATSIKDMKTETCDLMLTGHTHGGQLFPFHYFVRLVQPVIAGFKKVKGVLIFVHQGTGYWGPPMRWFSRSEIVVFEWE